MAKDFARGEHMMRRPDVLQGRQDDVAPQKKSTQHDRSLPSWANRGPAWEASDGDTLPPIPEHLKSNAWMKGYGGYVGTPQTLESQNSQNAQIDTSKKGSNLQEQGKKPLDLSKDPTKLAWASPLDMLDYLGLGVDVLERAYIEIGMKPGQEKEFARFSNTLYFTIDAAMAIMPGAGGGGLAVRASHEAGVAAWHLLPASAKAKVIQELAKNMGWTATRASQAVNVFFSMKAGKGNGKIGTGQTKGGMSRTTPQWRGRYGPGQMRQHHLVPQALLKDNRFIKRLKKLGIKDAQKFIDKKISQIPNSEHIKVHESGWNNDWKNWINKHPNFTIKDLESHIKLLMKKYNIPRNSRNFTRSYGK